MGTNTSCCKMFQKESEFRDNYIISSKKSILFIIKLQAIFRGYLFRKKRKVSNRKGSGNGIGINDNYFSNDKKPGLEVSFTTEPKTELNSKVLKLKELMAPFELNEKETFLLKNNYLRKYAFLYQDNSLYKGYYNKDWQKEGYGVFYRSDGCIYEGFFKSNRAEGRGRLLHVDGFCYEGDFLNSKANGFGKYVNLEGLTYLGYWKNDMEDGFGNILTRSKYFSSIDSKRLLENCLSSTEYELWNVLDLYSIGFLEPDFNCKSLL
jgi:hypothetical protein